MRKQLSVLALLLLASAAPLQAGDRAALGLKVGSLGIGLDLTARVNNWVSIRGTFSRYDFRRTSNESGNDYEGDFELGGYGVLCDVFPMRGNFRITGGLLKNRNNLELTSTPSSPIAIGGSTYPPGVVGTLHGNVRFRPEAPYLGIGYGSAARPGLPVRFVLDAGVMSQGRGEASLSSSSGLIAPGDMESERRQIEDEAGKYRFWPVIALGVSFRF